MLPIPATKAIETATTMCKTGKQIWLCEDFGHIGEFSNDLIAEKIRAKDWAFFQEEYPRFLARVEGLGTGFQTLGDASVRSPINFGLIQQVSDAIQEMPADKKQEMLEHLKIYRVDLCDQEIELDRMKTIISPEEAQSNFTERRKLVCRFLLALFSHEFLFEMDALKHVSVAYANYLFDLVKADESSLVGLINLMTKDELMRRVEFFENQIALSIADADHGKLTEDVILFIRILDYFHRSNVEVHRIKATEFINEVLSDKLNLKFIAALYYTHKNKPPSPQKPFLILEYPWLFSTEAKVDVLQEENACTQNSEIINQINSGLQQGNFMNLLNPAHMHLNIAIRRSHVLEDALYKLSNQGKNLKKPLRVSFAGEAGVDAGGVKKEFFGLLTKELFNPMYAMFTVKNVVSTDLGTVLLVQPRELRGSAQLRAGRNPGRPSHLQFSAAGLAAPKSGLQETAGRESRARRHRRVRPAAAHHLAQHLGVGAGRRDGPDLQHYVRQLRNGGDRRPGAWRPRAASHQCEQAGVRRPLRRLVPQLVSAAAVRAFLQRLLQGHLEGVDQGSLA